MKSARLDTPCTRQWTGQRSGREQRAGGGLGCVVCVLSGRVPDLSDELLLLLALLLGLPAELLRSGVRGGRCGGGGSRSPQSLLRGVEPPARILHPNAPFTQPASSLSAIPLMLPAHRAADGGCYLLEVLLLGVPRSGSRSATRSEALPAPGAGEQRLGTPIRGLEESPTRVRQGAERAHAARAGGAAGPGVGLLGLPWRCGGGRRGAPRGAEPLCERGQAAVVASERARSTGVGQGRGASVRGFAPGARAGCARFWLADGSCAVPPPPPPNAGASALPPLGSVCCPVVCWLGAESSWGTAESANAAVSAGADSEAASPPGMRRGEGSAWPGSAPCPPSAASGSAFLGCCSGFWCAAPAAPAAAGGLHWGFSASTPGSSLGFVTPAVARRGRSAEPSLSFERAGCGSIACRAPTPELGSHITSSVSQSSLSVLSASLAPFWPLPPGSAGLGPTL